jgi:hypothetical protein
MLVSLEICKGKNARVVWNQTITSTMLVAKNNEEATMWSLAGLRLLVMLCRKSRLWFWSWPCGQDWFVRPLGNLLNEWKIFFIVKWNWTANKRMSNIDLVKMLSVAYSPQKPQLKI